MVDQRFVFTFTIHRYNFIDSYTLFLNIGAFPANCPTTSAFVVELYIKTIYNLIPKQPPRTYWYKGCFWHKLKNAFIPRKPTFSFYCIFIVPQDTCRGRQANRWDGWGDLGAELSLAKEHWALFSLWLPSVEWSLSVKCYSCKGPVLHSPLKGLFNIFKTSTTHYACTVTKPWFIHWLCYKTRHLHPV